jgi:hypothetical protein
MKGISTRATLLSALMKVYTIPCLNRGNINVMLVVQSCTVSVQVMADSSSVTIPTSSDGTYHVSNVKFEVDLDMQGEDEVNVKTEEVEFINIKHEDGIYSEEEKEEDMNTKEDKDVDVKEEVSCEDILYRLKG